jgi:hypothetical protein
MRLAASTRATNAPAWRRIPARRPCEFEGAVRGGTRILAAEKFQVFRSRCESPRLALLRTGASAPVAPIAVRRIDTAD